MNKMKPILQLVNGKKIYLKKGIFGYRIINPYKDENGKLIIVNLLFGGWGNLFKLFFIMLIFFLLYFGMKEMLSSCSNMAQNPCDYFNNLICTNNIREYPQEVFSISRG